MCVILQFAKNVMPRLGPQIVNVIKRLFKPLDSHPLDHDALEDERSFEDATQRYLEMKSIITWKGKGIENRWFGEIRLHEL